MATGTAATSPPSRSTSFAASAEDRLFLWGGRGRGRIEPKEIYVYSVNSETWMKEITKGLHPPDVLRNGGCILAGRCMYLYGGCDSSKSDSGSLYELNTDNFTWRELSNEDNGPLKKYGCGIVTYKDQLLIVGGHFGSHNLSSRQPGSRYDSGCTNELHSYSLSTRLWSSPSVKGVRPPPCSSFSLTMIDEEHAVMFGGLSYGRSSAYAYVLDMSTMIWESLLHREGDSWPEGRYGHIAVCLGYGKEYKRVLISGGAYSGKILNDVWLLNPQSGQCEEVLVANKMLVERYGHSAASFTINPECVEVVVFGGSRGTTLISDTAVLRFELKDFQLSGQKSWILTDVADHTQLGSLQRLEKKIKLMQSYSSGRVDDQVRKLQQQPQEMQIRAQDSDNRAVTLERRLHEANTRANESDRRAEESDRRAEESDRRAAESDRRAEESVRRAQESDRRAQESDRRAEESVRRINQLQGELTAARQQQREVEHNLQEHIQDAQLARQDAQLARQIAQLARQDAQLAREQLRECEERLVASTSHWIVRREEIEMTGPELGRGGWAIVSVAKFRGVCVAAKTIHQQIISHHNIQLFRREMNMAARLCHPNLVQFIGATIEGTMMILTELMPTSLRAQLQRDIYLPPLIVRSITLDVARALNYLHQMQPDPIIHRDISSANVLLEPLRDGQWRAKLSDYGTVNLYHQLETVNPGSPVYAAPEASNPRLQTSRMDIYSFGALILEMLTGQLPTPEDRPALLLRVHHDQLLALIRRCLSESVQRRPNAATIIRELEN